MTTDDACQGDSDCCAELHKKVDRLLELLDDRREYRVKITTMADPEPQHLDIGHEQEKHENQ